MVRFLITIPNDLRDTLKTAAACRGQTLTGFIRSILWDWKTAHEHQDDTRIERG